MSSQLADLRVAMVPTVATTDVALWLGQYPFRGLKNVSVEDLETRMGALNVERGIVGPLEGVFWENSVDAYDRLADEIAGGGMLEPWPVLRPGVLKSGLERMLDRYRPRGMRLCPNYHGYRLSDPAAAELFELARQRKMIVQIFQRLADERWHYLLKVPAVDVTDLEYVTAVYGEMRVIFSGVQPLEPWAHRLRQLPNLYMDVSRVRGPQAAIEGLVKQLPTEKLLFGSLWPIQVIEATLWQVTTAAIEPGVRAAILRDNAKKLLGD